MKRVLLLLFVIFTFVLASCGETQGAREPQQSGSFFSPVDETFASEDVTYGEDISEEINKGYFEEEEVRELSVTCLSGTPNAYRWDGDTLTFTSLLEDSVYSVSGKLAGSIAVDIGEERKLDLELCGVSIISDKTSPITVVSGNKVTLTAKKDYENYVYDKREKVNSDEEGVYSATVYSVCDLELAGKGALVVSSDNNNGIHSKDDLEVKNLTLTVSACDNALKGNDSVTLQSGCVTAIAKNGDGIKTSNSGISKKGKQQGTVAILGGEHTVYAACDGIDAAYNVEIEGSDTKLSVYTDKYSNYSEDVTETSKGQYYIRYSSKSYSYSIKLYKADGSYTWVNATYHSAVSGGRQGYYYYSFNKDADCQKMQIYIYSSAMEQGQDESYVACTDYLTPSEAYDTFAISTRGNSLSYTWTNYTTKVSGGMGGPGGFGGMNEGNSDKGTYSTKGIKAANEITINGGAITVKSYDDAIHAGGDALENGSVPTGGVSINGGELALYSNDDGIHADGALVISGGTISVANSYEGAEGDTVKIKGGALSIIAKDDGINATATSGTTISIQGGYVYIWCTGDGIDSNSRASYSGIAFSGGDTVIISNSSMNSAIDSEQGYSYTGGRVLAISPSGGMSGEATHCQGFSSVATDKNISLASGKCLTVSVGGDEVVAVILPVSINGRVIYLGSSSASYTVNDNTSFSPNGNLSFDGSGVLWSK